MAPTEVQPHLRFSLDCTASSLSQWTAARLSERQQQNTDRPSSQKYDLGACVCLSESTRLREKRQQLSQRQPPMG